MQPLIDVQDLAEELDMSDAGIRYRVNKLKLEKIYRLNNRLAIYEKDADLIRNFKKERTNENPPWVQDFINEVREEMYDRNETTISIAEGAGMSQSMVSHILNGGRKLSIKNAEKLADALGMKVILCLGDTE